jgi:hypothetical protein
MALVGVLSTGLLHEQFVRRPPDRASGLRFLTLVDRTLARSASAIPPQSEETRQSP